MKTFATKDNPLRGSSGPMLLKCSLRLYLLAKGVIVDGDSEAAQTGSVTHKAIELFHAGVAVKSVWKKTLSAVGRQYPKAKLDKAEAMFEGYRKDPRNKAKPVLCEAEVVIRLDPWEDDTTGQDIYILGHLDQVRKIDGRLCVVDVKCSSKGGNDLVADYAAQIVIYALGASQKLKKPVEPGFILRATSYITEKNQGIASPDDVFHPIPFTMSEVQPLVDEIRKEVARVRAGVVGPRPSSACTYCPAGHAGYCSSLLKGVS